MMHVCPFQPPYLLLRPQSWCLLWAWLLVGSLLVSAAPANSRQPKCDETAGQRFPVRELGVYRSFPADSNWPTDVVSAETGAVAKEFGVAWLHCGRREGVAFTLYRCPNRERALGLARLIGGEALGDTVMTLGLAKDEEKLAAVRNFLRTQLTAWQAKLPPEESSERPVVLCKLPVQALQPGTEHYAVGALGLAHANWLRANALLTPPGSAFAWADYTPTAPFDHFLIAEYPTPQDATAALETARQLASATCLVARRGNFIVIADGIRDMLRAQAAVEGIEYDYVVRWLGNPPPYLSSRTPQQDVRNLGRLLISIASFVVLAGVSMVFFGVVAGGAFFYWRRQRAGNGFIAADTMLRLNLNEDFALPEAKSRPIKRLTD